MGAADRQDGLSRQPRGKGRLRALGLAQAGHRRVPLRGRILQGVRALSPVAMDESAAPRQDDIRGAILVSIAGLGLSSIVTQLSLLRELLGAFSGNELVRGICLGNWFALTAAGAWIGEVVARLRRPGRVFAAGQFAAALIPLAQVAAVRGLRDIVFLRGETVSLTGTWCSSLVLDRK